MTSIIDVFFFLSLFRCHFFSIQTKLNRKKSNEHFFADTFEESFNYVFDRSNWVCLCTHFISVSLAQTSVLFVTELANTHRYSSSSIFISINYLNAMRRMQCVLCVRKCNLLLIFKKKKSSVKNTYAYENTNIGCGATKKRREANHSQRDW